MRTRSRRVVVAVMAAAMLGGSASTALAVPRVGSVSNAVIAATDNNRGPRIGSVSNAVIAVVENGGPRIGSVSNSVLCC
jgi:hypothetical protein